MRSGDASTERASGWRINGLNFRRGGLKGGEKLRDGWFAVSHHLLGPDQVSGRHRNRIYRLSTDTGVAYRTLRFAANIDAGKSEGPAVLAIDHQGWLELGGFRRHPQREMTVSIRLARAVERPVAMWRHPNPADRLAFKLSLLSVFLGGLGVVIGVVGAIG